MRLLFSLLTVFLAAQWAWPQNNAGSEAVVVAVRGSELVLSVGAEDGVQRGAVYGVERQGQLRPRVRVTTVRATESSALLMAAPEDDLLAVGDTVRFIAVEPLPAAPSLAAPAQRPLAQTPSNQTPSNQTPLASGLPATAGGTSTSGTVASSAGGSAASGANAATANAATANAATGTHRSRGRSLQRVAGALVGAAIVATAISRRSARPDPENAFSAPIQFSTVSPFPGGGYSIRPDGTLQPGGAMQVNIPIAYAPRRVTGVAGVYVAQSRQGNTLSSENGRNGTATLGIGFSLSGRGAWFSRMALSQKGLNGGDAAYNVLLQIAPETARRPALAIGVQDLFRTEDKFSPFLVATRQLNAAQRPLYVSLGVGAGRFSGSALFGGLSFSPFTRLSLSAEYDGIQTNLGAGYALTRRFTLLGSSNDIFTRNRNPAGKLGRRFQFGGTYGF